MELTTRWTGHAAFCSFFRYSGGVSFLDRGPYVIQFDQPSLFASKCPKSVRGVLPVPSALWQWSLSLGLLRISNGSNTNTLTLTVQLSRDPPAEFLSRSVPEC